jgi:hypothetical protein
MPSQISASAQKEKNASANARARFGGTVGLWTGIQLDFRKHPVNLARSRRLSELILFGLCLSIWALFSSHALAAA